MKAKLNEITVCSDDPEHNISEKNTHHDITLLLFIIWIFATILLLNMTNTLLGACLEVIMTCVIIGINLFI